MKTIIWKGLDEPSMEYFQLEEEEAGFSVRSRVIGTRAGKPFLAEYSLSTDEQRTVKHFYITCEWDKRQQEIRGLRDRSEWKINGVIAPEYSGFIFIDLPLTPFTNTLPIEKLQLAIGAEQEISVLYLDIPEGVIRPVRQRYRRISEWVYHYENIPRDFEADITVDASGLVLSYPALFERVATDTQ